MAKKEGLILILIMAIMAIHPVEAAWDSFYAISSSDFVCSSHGDIKFNAKTMGVDTKDVKIQARHSSEANYFDVSGIWYNSLEDEVTRLQSGENVMFMSSGDLFTKTGDYFIRIAYPDTSKEVKISCPAFKFSCSDIKIDIEECYSDKYDFVVVFLGENLENQPTKLDLFKDLEYQIVSQRQEWDFGSLPKNLTIISIEDNKYEMRFPSNPEYPSASNALQSIEIRVKEDLGSILQIDSGCFRGVYDKIYQGTKDIEKACPTRALLEDNEVNSDVEENTEDEEKPKETIKAEEVAKVIWIPASIISGIIFFIIGCLITAIILSKKK